MKPDKELLGLFRMESEEHLQKINGDLLSLEKNPDDRGLLEEVSREAHSIKGAARMLGEKDIELVAHTLEDIFGAANRGDIRLTSGIIDRVYKGLDAIRKLVDSAVTGKPSAIVVSDVISALGGGEAEKNPSPAEKPREEDAGAETAKDVKDFRIETVRVGTQALDRLLTQVGELNVTRLQVSRQLGQIDEILSMWEELPRFEASVERRAFQRTVKKNEELEKLETLLSSLRKSIYENNSRLEFIANQLTDGVHSIRLIPLSAIFSLFPRMVRDICREKGKEADTVIEGAETAADKRILEEIKDPLMHLIRNALDHGIENPDIREANGKPRKGTITIKGYRAASSIVIEVADDGGGLNTEEIKNIAIKRNLLQREEAAVMSEGQINSLVFRSGFSTSSFISDISGRGVGLDVVRTNVERLKGKVEVDSVRGKGCCFRIRLPVTLSTLRVLIVSAGDMNFAIPVEFAGTLRFIGEEDIFSFEGRPTVKVEGRAVSVARLSELLDMEEAKKGDAESGRCIFLSVNGDEMGLMVDDIADELEIVLKPRNPILKRVRNISGTAILGTGEVCLVLNPYDIFKALRKKSPRPSPPPPAEKEKIARKKSLLLVEDSITTRTQEKHILEGAGYEVETAVDGMDAMEKLLLRDFDGIVADIQMPKMDGLTMTKKIREDRKYREIPVILVTALASDEDRKRGLEAGADAYITKPAFDQTVLLEALRRLV